VAGLVGRNGTGKTTLINLCAGLIRPTAGELKVFGETPASENPELLGLVGLVSQRRAVYGWMSVGGLLDTCAKLNPTWDRDVANRSLEAIGIPAKQKAGRLSEGERAQLCLVLALGKRPRLLLLDEPFANVDPVARRSLMGLLLDRVAAVLGVESLRVLERWQGVYASSPQHPYLVHELRPGVTVVAVTSGVGMTISLGLARKVMGALY
jgi:ABC-2 type transport system ATP-binding protein